MGYPLDDLLDIPDTENIPSLANETFNLNYLPDYEEQQAKVGIAQQQYKSAKSTFYPKLSFTSNSGKCISIIIIADNAAMAVADISNFRLFSNSEEAKK